MTTQEITEKQIRAFAKKLDIKIRWRKDEWEAYLGAGATKCWQTVGGTHEIVTTLEEQSGVKFNAERIGRIGDIQVRVDMYGIEALNGGSIDGEPISRGDMLDTAGEGDRRVFTEADVDFS